MRKLTLVWLKTSPAAFLLVVLVLATIGSDSPLEANQAQVILPPHSQAVESGATSISPPGVLLLLAKSVLVLLEFLHL